MKITIEVSRNSHRYITLMDLLRRDHYQFSIEAENEALQQHGVMQAKGSDGVLGAAVGKAGGLQDMCVWFAGSPPWQRLASRWHCQLCITDGHMTSCRITG